MVGETTYWLAVIFNDHNSNNVRQFLEIPDILCSGAEKHIVFMCNCALNQARCCHEVVTRLLAVLDSLENPEDSDQKGSIIKAGEMTRYRSVLPVMERGP